MTNALTTATMIGALTLIGTLMPNHSATASDREPSHLRMALVNMKSVYSDLPDDAAKQAALQTNIQRHLMFVDRAAEQGADFVGFPELSINGYRFSANMAWLKLDGPEVAAIAARAVERKVYVSVGLAEQDAEGKRWNTQIVIAPDGKVIGRHHKLWLTKERGHTQAGESFTVLPVKGIRIGILTCADGSDYQNLKATVDAGAQLIYAAHANTTGGTIARWYAFRAAWGGQWNGEYAEYPTNNDGPKARAPKGGWINQLGVHAALHNHAALYGPDFSPPPGNDANTGWASGAWFIGPDGGTLAQMPPSADRNDSREFMLIHNIPAP